MVSFDQTEQELVDDLEGIGILLRDHLEKDLFIYTISTDAYADHIAGEFSLDSVHSLLQMAPDVNLLRKEVSRFFTKLKGLGITSLIISERGQRDFDLDFLSDCNIMLDMRLEEEQSTRRICVTKLRGSSHQTNEFPFLIGEEGIQVLPLTSIRMDYETPDDRIPTRIPGFDRMLEDKGYFKGSSILISGTPGTGKTSLALWLADAACLTDSKTLFFSFEESESQLLRNIGTLGLDLSKHCGSGCLHFHTGSSSEFSMEHHVGRFLSLCRTVGPDLVVFDPVSNMINVGSPYQVKNLLMRMIDFFKRCQITSIFTSLAYEEGASKEVAMEISSLMDLWIRLDSTKVGDKRKKTLQIVKARGIDCDTSDKQLIMGQGRIAVEDLVI